MRALHRREPGRGYIVETTVAEKYKPSTREIRQRIGEKCAAYRERSIRLIGE